VRPRHGFSTPIHFRGGYECRQSDTEVGLACGRSDRYDAADRVVLSSDERKGTGNFARPSSSETLS